MKEEKNVHMSHCQSKETKESVDRGSRKTIEVQVQHEMNPRIASHM